MQLGPMAMSISCNMLFILKMYVLKPHLTFFANQIVCVGAKCTVLHIV